MLRSMSIRLTSCDMPLAEILLVSRLLGLVAGNQRVEIQPDRTVHKVEIERDGERVATLKKAPWKASVNFGYELGRDVQAINVARPPAELGVLVERGPDGKSKALIHWAHFAYRPPSSVVVKLDGRTINKSRAVNSVPLGVLKGNALHVLGVEV